MLVCGCGNPQCEMGPKVRCYECGADTHLIEERTQARAEAFRAQERVRELEDLLASWGLLVAQRVERLTLGGVDREHEREENRAMDAVRAEAVECARARRKG